MDILLLVVVITTFIFLTAYTKTLQKFLGTTYRLPAIWQIDEADIPEDLRDLLEAGTKPLTDLGFRMACFARQDLMEPHENAQSWMAILYLDDEQTEARVSAAIGVTKFDPISVEFATRYDDGVQITSQNGLGVFNPLSSSRFVWHDPDADQISVLWRAHLDQLKAHEAEVSGTYRVWGTPADNIEAYNQVWNSDIDDAVAAGAVRRVEHGFRISLTTALSMIKQAQRRQKTRKRVRNRRRAQANTSPDSFASIGNAVNLTGAQARSITLLMEDQHSRTASGWYTWVIFFGSMALFSLFFGLWLGWSLVPLLIGVLLFHELGHFVAMHLVGYKELSVFFIPGLGAAVSGHAENVGVWKRIFVFLAGPLPGILVAFLLMFLVPEREQWLESTILFMIILNWFNLLPFMPLDGGQVINSLLGITGRTIFKWVSAVGLFALAWMMGEPILWVLGVFSALSALSFRFTAKLQRSLYAEDTETLGRADYLDHAVGALQASQYDELDIAERVSTIDTVMQERGVLHPGWLGVGGGMLLYILIFLAPIWMFVVGLAAIDEVNLGDVVEPEWQTQIESAASPDEAFARAMEAVSYQLEYYDPEQARIYIDQAVVLKPERSVHEQSQLLRAEIQLVLISGDSEDTSHLLFQYLEQYRLLQMDPDKDYVKLLTQVFYTLPEEGPLTSTDLLGDVIGFIDNGGAAPENTDILMLQAAQLEYGRENTALAIEYIELGLTLDGDSNHLLKNELVRILSDQEEYARAAVILEELVDDEFVDHNTLEWAAWVSLFRGEESLALLHMEAARVRMNEDQETSLILDLLIDTSYKIYEESDSLINLLAAYDYMGETEKITGIVRDLQNLDSDDELSLLAQRREMLRNELKYSQGFELKVSRIKLKALNRYFPDE